MVNSAPIARAARSLAQTQVLSTLRAWAVPWARLTRTVYVNALAADVKKNVFGAIAAGLGLGERPRAPLLLPHAPPPRMVA